MPPDSIVDGAIIDGGAVAAAIRRIFDRKTFKTKDVAASLSGNAVIVKKISLPVMTEAELSESIYWEAEQYIPFDIQDVNLDYQILDAGTRRATPRARWKCSWSRRRKKKSPTTPASSRRPAACRVIVDVDAFALQNAFEANYGLEPQPGGRADQRRRERRSTSTLCRGTVALHPRHLARRQCLHRSRPARAEPAVRERRARQEGHARRRASRSTMSSRCCTR